MEIAHKTEDTEGRLSDLLIAVRDVLRRRWLTLATISLGVFAAGVAVMMMMTPQYESVTRIRIDPSQNPLSDKSRNDQNTLSPEAIETEVTVLRSLDLARQVVRQLKLTEDGQYRKLFDKRPDAAQMNQMERETLVAQTLLDNLSVGRENLTYILGVKFRAEDPVKAARIVNSFADTYLKTKAGFSTGTAERQSEWFRKRLAELSDEMRHAEMALADYRARTGLVDGGERSGIGTIVDQQVAPLSSSLAAAESDAAAARAAVSAAERQIGSGGIDSVTEVRNSMVIADLRRQRAEILRNMGEVQARYGDRHPESIRVRDQLAAIDSQIKDEARRVVNSLRSAAEAADARAGSLRQSMGRLEGQRATNARAAAMVESLAREAAAKRQAYDRMAEMSLTSTQAAQNSIAQAVIVDQGQIPSRPASPNKPLILALALVVGLVAGTATISVQEMLVSGMRTVDEVESTLGIPVLSAIPVVPKSTNPADLLLKKPTSLFSESLRIARASILGVRSTRPPQIIALTSALPSEGKTTTALAFARVLAMNNARTLLLECDVRRAQMRHLVTTPPAPVGIVEVLHGDADVRQAITPGDIPGLDHLLVSEPYFSSEDLFGGGAMDTLLKGLRASYDMIVLDLPPLVGLADGRFLAAMADATVLIVRWDSTPPAAASSALSWLRSDGANPVGAIFTMVDTSAEAIGGLYYSKKYSAYYQQD